MRACALPPQLRQAVLIGDEPACEFPVLAIEEVFAGKIRAMIDRKHPRDLYDLFRFRKAGLRYDSDLMRRLAPIVERAKDREQFIVSGVGRPLSILKQIMQSFVSANGPSFVEANPWIRKFIRNSRNQEWSPDLFAYIFATNTRGGRKSGLGAFFDFGRKRIRTVAEFSFWPLGMVLSFDSLDEYPVTPIHHWAQYDYSWPGQLDINLVVNPTSSAYALDFRIRAEMNRDAFRIEPRPKVAGETLRE